MQAYLKDLYGDSFVTFATRIQQIPTSEDPRELELLKKKNLDILNKNSELKFPEDYNNFPYHVRQIFEYYKSLIKKQDLLDFCNGLLYHENIINVYFKILEKINLVN